MQSTTEKPGIVVATFPHTQTVREGGFPYPRFMHTYTLLRDEAWKQAVMCLTDTQPCEANISEHTRPSSYSIHEEVRGRLMRITFTQAEKTKRTAQEIPMTITLEPLYG